MGFQQRQSRPQPAIAPSVSNPPFRSPAILAAILLAWQPIQDQPQRINYVIPIETKQPYFSITPTTLSNIIQQWQPAPYSVNQNKLCPSILAVPENEPPYDNRKVNYNTTIQNWQIVLTQPQINNKLAQESVAVITQPSINPEYLSIIIQNWQIASDQIQIRKFIPLPSVDNPPFIEKKNNLSVIIQSWQPIEYQPQRVKSIAVVAETAVQVSKSQTNLNVIRQNWEYESYRVTQNKLSPNILNATDQPPNKSNVNLNTIIQSWQIYTSQPQINNKLIQEFVTVDTFTPFNNQINVDIIPRLWQIDESQIQTRKYTVLYSVDNPPKKSNVNLYTIVNNWIPILIQPQIGVKFTISIDNPPFDKKPWLSTIIQSWQSETPQIIKRNFFTTETIIGSDDPPFGQRIWLLPIIYASQPWIPQPQSPWKLPPSILNVPVNDPPYGQRLWLSTVLSSWEPPPPKPQARRITIPIPTVVLWFWRRIL